jgi:glutamine amidotransferase
VQKSLPESITIAVVDYGAGNLRSVRRALDAVGQKPVVTSDPHVVECAHGLVLPGVGSANDAMKALHQLGLVQPLRDYAASGRPFLGVCVGLQLLFDWSEEGGGAECLGIIPGTVRRLQAAEAGIKVPHMGWNNVWFKYEHPLLAGVPNDSHFYFVHSYYADPLDRTVVIGGTSHGVDFPAIVARDNVVAVQFHPEKSAELGLRLYENFAKQVASHQSQFSGHRH